MSPPSSRALPKAFVWEIFQKHKSVSHKRRTEPHGPALVLLHQYSDRVTIQIKALSCTRRTLEKLCFFLPIPNLQFPKVLHQFRHRAVSSQRVVLLVEGIHVLQPMKRDPLPLRVVIVRMQDRLSWLSSQRGTASEAPWTICLYCRQRF